MDTRRLTRGIGWLWVGYLGRSLGYFALIVVFTRSLGAHGFGTLSLFLAVTLGISQVAGSWPFLAVPVLSARSGSIAAAFRPALYVAALATAASLLVAIPVCLALGIDAPVSLLAVFACSTSLVGLQGAFAVLQTEGGMSGIALLQTGERLVALVLALALAATVGIGVVGAEVTLTVASVMTCLAAFVVLGRRHDLLRRSPAEMPDHLVSTVMDCVGPMGFASLCSYGVAYVDIFILAIFRSNSEVGTYSLAYQIFSFVTQLTTYWVVVALPEHARSTASGEGIREQLRLPQLMRYTGLWAALVAVVGVVGAFCLPLVFGSEFEDAAVPLLLLLGGSGIFAAVYFTMLPALIGAGRSSLVARVAVGSVLINICLDLVLVPAFGVIGPAIATCGQSLFGSGALAVVVLGLVPALRLLSVVAPAAAATILLAVDPDDPLLAALCVVVALATALLSLRGGRGPQPTLAHGSGVSGA